MKKAENYFYDDYYELMPFQHKKTQRAYQKHNNCRLNQKKAQVGERESKTITIKKNKTDFPSSLLLLK